MGPHFVVQAAKKAWVTDPLHVTCSDSRGVPLWRDQPKVFDAALHPPKLNVSTILVTFWGLFAQETWTDSLADPVTRICLERKSLWEIVEGGPPTETNKVTRGQPWSMKDTHELQLNHVETITRDSSNSLSLIVWSWNSDVLAVALDIFSIFDSRYPQALPWGTVSYDACHFHKFYVGPPHGRRSAWHGHDILAMSHGYVPHTDVSTLQITAMATAFLFFWCSEFLMFGFLDNSEFCSDFLSNFHSSSSKINPPNNQNNATQNENAMFLGWTKPSSSLPVDQMVLGGISCRLSRPPGVSGSPLFCGDLTWGSNDEDGWGWMKMDEEVSWKAPFYLSSL